MSNRGFTIMETVMYLALCGLLLGTLLPVAYQLRRAADRVANTAEAIDEAVLIDRTVHWAVASAQSVTLPTAGELVLNGSDGVQMAFVASEQALFMTRGSGPATALNVEYPLSSGRFALKPGADGNPGELEFSFVLGTTPFEFRYDLPRLGPFPITCSR